MHHCTSPIRAPRPTALALGAALSILGVLVALLPARVGAQDYAQRVLGPGLYAYQTRVRSATCGDDEATGHVSTFVASINGVPGSRTMEMELVNSQYWPSWTMTVMANGHIAGVARAEGRSSRFEVHRDDGKFVGTGSRTYTRTTHGHAQECTVHVDVLLRRFDV